MTAAYLRALTLLAGSPNGFPMSLLAANGIGASVVEDLVSVGLIRVDTPHQGDKARSCQYPQLWLFIPPIARAIALRNAKSADHGRGAAGALTALTWLNAHARLAP
jgi:hypothetical protein